MDMADIGYDFLGPLLDNNLAMTYKNAYYDKIPDNLRIPKVVGQARTGERSVSWLIRIW